MTGAAPHNPQAAAAPLPATLHDAMLELVRRLARQAAREDHKAAEDADRASEQRPSA